MKESLKKLSEIVATANDLFYQRNQSVDTLMGIMDQTLRKQGMHADAVTIDCIAIDKKIVLVLHDSKPTFVDIALGDKAGVVHSSAEYALSDITTTKLLDMMEVNFLTKKNKR